MEQNKNKARRHNSTFAIGGVSCSADSLVVAETFVLHINICAKNPAHRKSAKRYKQYKMRTTYILTVLLLSTFHLFGQEQKFFVNDSLFDFQTDICWPLTKKLQSTELKNNHDFEIQKAEIINNNLQLDIYYGGGCGNVYLKLYVDNSIDLTNELKIQLFPEFQDNDMCKAIKYRRVCFDLDTLLKGRKNQLLLKIGKYDLTIPAK